jgi:hypothetical protein
VCVSRKTCSAFPQEARRDSQPLGEGGGIPADSQPLVHSQENFPVITGPAPSSALFLKKFRMKEEMPLIIKNENPETHTEVKEALITLQHH